MILVLGQLRVGWENSELSTYPHCPIPPLASIQPPPPSQRCSILQQTAKTSFNNWIHVLSLFIAIIPNHFLCQLQMSSHDVEFLRTIFKFRKRETISSMLVYVPHEISKQEVSSRSRVGTARKCTRKRAAPAKLLLSMATVIVPLLLF